MVSAWYFIANVSLPVPLVLFSLLALPLPRNVHRGTQLFVSKVFDLQLVGIFKLLHIALFISALSLLAALRQVAYTRQLGESTIYATANQELTVLSRRWRAERNVWIASFALAAWLAVATLYKKSLEHESVRGRLEQLERRARGPLDGVTVSDEGAPAVAPTAARAHPAPSDILDETEDEELSEPAVEGKKIA